MKQDLFGNSKAVILFNVLNSSRKQRKQTGFNRSINQSVVFKVV